MRRGVRIAFVLPSHSIAPARFESVQHLTQDSVELQHSSKRLSLVCLVQPPVHVFQIFQVFAVLQPLQSCSIFFRLPCLQNIFLEDSFVTRLSKIQGRSGKRRTCTSLLNKRRECTGMSPKQGLKAVAKAPAVFLRAFKEASRHVRFVPHVFKK